MSYAILDAEFNDESGNKYTAKELLNKGWHIAGWWSKDDKICINLMNIENNKHRYLEFHLKIS